MSRLFDGYDIEEAEGVPVQYVGVYLLKWREHPEHPTMAFVESKYTTEMFDELLAACEGLMDEMAEADKDWCLLCERATGHDDRCACTIAKAAIANVKGE